MFNPLLVSTPQKTQMNTLTLSSVILIAVKLLLSY